MSKLNKGFVVGGCDVNHTFRSRNRELQSAPETANLFLCRVRCRIVNFDDSASSAFGNLFSARREP